jgi:hypothetical protein
MKNYTVLRHVIKLYNFSEHSMKFLSIFISLKICIFIGIAVKSQGPPEPLVVERCRTRRQPRFHTEKCFQVSAKLCSLCCPLVLADLSSVLDFFK